MIPGVSLAATLGITLSARPEADRVVEFKLGDSPGFRTQWSCWEDTLVHAGTFLNPRVRLFRNVCGPLLLWHAELKFYPEARAADIERFMSRCAVLSANGVRRVMPMGSWVSGIGVGLPTFDDWRHETGGPINRWATLGAGEKLKLWIYSHEPFRARHDFRFQISLRIERPTGGRPATARPCSGPTRLTPQLWYAAQHGHTTIPS